MQISAKPDTSSRPLELAFTLSLSGQVPQSRGRRAVPARGRRKAAGRLRARQCRQHMHAGGGARFLSRPPSDRHSRPAGGGGGGGFLPQAPTGTSLLHLQVAAVGPQNEPLNARTPLAGVLHPRGAWEAGPG